MHDDQAKLVFISYASPDRKTADRLRELLESEGIHCWMAPHDIAPGKEYSEEIIKAIEAATVLVLVFSEHANASRHVATEVSRAFSKNKVIMPVRIQNVQPAKCLELFVSSSHWVDAWGEPLENRTGRMAAAIREAVGSVAPGSTGGSSPTSPRHRSKWLRVTGIATSVILVFGALFFLKQRLFPSHNEGDLLRGVPLPLDKTGNATVSSTNTSMNYRLLAIGINDYSSQATKGWGSLKTARPDAAAVADLLESQYGFTVERLFDREATHGAVLGALDAVASLPPDQAVVIYFAGHGFYDPVVGEGYWIPSDAHKTSDGRPAKEDWIGNSTLTRILSASAARHILVIADSCYSGSLMDENYTTPAGEQQAASRHDANRPSRYLITSGSLEPVSDSRETHSAFARQLLEELSKSDRNIVSASTLGSALKTQVAKLTGQTVRTGPLALAGHTGGDFLFARKGATAYPPAIVSEPRIENPPDASDRNQLLRDALALGRNGATNAALRLLASAPKGEDRLTQVVADYLAQERRSKTHDELRELITRVERQKTTTKTTGKEQPQPMAKPRILACLGPTSRQGTSEGENQALLYRICLSEEMQGRRGVQVIEREAIEQVLQEMNLGASSLADSRAATAVGKLLPAGMLLLGDLLSTKSGERVFLRLVDTETSRILATFTADRNATGDVTQVCQNLAARILDSASKAKPLTTAITRIDGQSLQASIGTFHGADIGTTFEVIRRTQLGSPPSADFKEQSIGTARISRLGETSSELTAMWTTAVRPEPSDVVWLKEIIPAQPPTTP
ncbi:MAG: TIR domain-containing protein [bacterium]